MVATMTTVYYFSCVIVLAGLMPRSYANDVTTSSVPANPDSDPPQRPLLGDGLDPAVGIGVGVAGGILLIALILLAIYCCVRNKNDASKDQQQDGRNNYADSTVYSTGTSHALFKSGQYPKGKYGSMEDIKSTNSSQDRNNGAYSNQAYTRDPSDKSTNKPGSVRKPKGKAGFANDAFDTDDGKHIEQTENSWEEKETSENGGSKRLSRKDANGNQKPMKSALKKPAEIEMNPVAGAQQRNGILKTRAQSPDRSQTSSTDASFDPNALVYGYKHLGLDMPNVKHMPVIERRRSRSGTRSHRSGSSGGRSRRSKSPEKKKIPKTGRMYDDVFIDDRRHRSRSSGRRSRSDSSRRAHSERTSDSLDSESSTASQSRKVSMNPGGKRVHIKGEETDI